MGASSSQVIGCRTRHLTADPGSHEHITQCRSNVPGARSSSLSTTIKASASRWSAVLTSNPASTFDWMAFESLVLIQVSSDLTRHTSLSKHFWKRTPGTRLSVVEGTKQRETGKERKERTKRVLEIEEGSKGWRKSRTTMSNQNWTRAGRTRAPWNVNKMKPSSAGWQVNDFSIQYELRKSLRPSHPPCSMGGYL